MNACVNYKQYKNVMELTIMIELKFLKEVMFIKQVHPERVIFLAIGIS